MNINFYRFKRFKPSEQQKQTMLELVKCNWNNLALANTSQKAKIWSSIGEAINRLGDDVDQHKTTRQWKKVSF